MFAATSKPSLLKSSVLRCYSKDMPSRKGESANVLALNSNYFKKNEEFPVFSIESCRNTENEEIILESPILMLEISICFRAYASRFVFLGKLSANSESNTILYSKCNSKLSFNPLLAPLNADPK